MFENANGGRFMTGPAIPLLRQTRHIQAVFINRSGYYAAQDVRETQRTVLCNTRKRNNYTSSPITCRAKRSSRSANSVPMELYTLDCDLHQWL